MHIIADINLEREEYLSSSSIRRWGHAWQRFMEEYYPADVPKLKKSGRWDEISDKIEWEAHVLRGNIREAFMRVNPRPRTTFLEIMQWENELKMLTERQIMDDLVGVRWE